MATIRIISTAADGTQGNFGSGNPVFSPDGTKVAFDSSASNLGGGGGGIFEKDLLTGAITRVVGNGGGFIYSEPQYLPNGTLAYTVWSAPSGYQAVNWDGFISDKNAVGTVVWVPPGAGGGEELPLNSVFSRDGTNVAFDSKATNLVDGDTNSGSDIFVRNLGSGAITRVSLTADGSQTNLYADSFDPAFSADGTKVAFWSRATNLVAGDTNGTADIFVKDLTTGAVTRASITAGGVQANNESYGPVLSPDGTKVAFYSNASNLVDSDGNSTTDIFVKDLVTGELKLVSRNADGVQGDSSSTKVAFSPDGTMLVFSSDARNLVAGDTNRSSDIFIVSLSAQAAIAHDDAFAIGENGTATGNLFSDNGGGADVQGDDGPLSITPATGTTAKGGTYAVNADGTFTYDPNHAFDRLPGPASGASNGTATDSFSYALSGGAGATVTLTIAGVDSNDLLEGTGGTDTLKGGIGADTLKGLGGKDSLIGGGGKDSLEGGAGEDTLSGGNGKDTFSFKSTKDSAGSKRDTIDDFSRSQHDRIDLSAIDAIKGTAKNDKFSFLSEEGAAFTRHAGQLHFDHQGRGSNKITLVEADINGDGRADFAVQLKGWAHLTSGDFVL